MPRRLLKKADGTFAEYGGGGSSELEERVGKVEEAIEELQKGGGTDLTYGIYVGDTQPTNGVMYWLDTSGDSASEEDKPDTGGDETEVTLSSINATYTGGEVTVGTELTTLTGITVIGTYSDGSTATITDYTLSGEVAEGDNIITVTYKGLTATFTVVGVAEDVETSVDLSEENVYATGTASTGYIQLSNDTLQALDAENLYFYSFYKNQYQKKFTIRAKFTTSYGATAIVDAITPASANGGENDIVTSAYDHFADDGSITFKIDIGALKTAMQNLIADGTIDTTKGAPIVQFVNAMPVSDTTLYLLYNYAE